MTIIATELCAISSSLGGLTLVKDLPQARFGHVMPNARPKRAQGRTRLNVSFAVYCTQHTFLFSGTADCLFAVNSVFTF